MYVVRGNISLCVVGVVVGDTSMSAVWGGRGGILEMILVYMCNDDDDDGDDDNDDDG